MKKLFLLLVFAIVLIIGYLYLMIPSQILASDQVVLNLPEATVRKLVVYGRGIARWWPGVKPSGTTDSSGFHFQGTEYTLIKSTFNSASMKIQGSMASHISTLELMATGENTTLVKWTLEDTLPLHPLNRYKRYRMLEKLKKNNTELLLNLKSFTENDANVYGARFNYEKVKDSVVVSIRTISEEYPSTAHIYNMIGKLRRFSEENNITKPGYPMLNIAKPDGNSIHTTVALPVQRSLKKAPGNKIEFRRMVLNANLLTAQVTGGYQTVDNTLKQMEIYLRNNSLTSPAIPFQLLITDRTREADTTKWITKICYPIF